jgi:hypothetical protein
VQYFARASLLTAVLLTSACAFDKQGIDTDDGQADASLPDDAAPPDDTPGNDPPDARADASDIDAGENDPDAAPVDAPPSAPDAGKPDAMPIPPCPTGYNHGGEDGPNAAHCYKFVGIVRNWQQAENDCANDATGAHLITVDTQDEFDGIVGELSGQIWVGTTDRAVEGTFVYVTGGPFTFGHFKNGEPSNSGGGEGEDCLVLDDSNGQGGPGFNDLACTTLHTYVCEVDGIPPLP